MSTALAYPAVTPVPAPALTAELLWRRFGTREWDVALRATGLVGVLALPAVTYLPGAEPMILLVLATLWMRGPASAFIPIGLEPILMLYGRLYPVWLVVLVAVGASAYAEVLSLHLMRGVLALRLLDRVRSTMQGSRVMRLFARRPAAAIALAASSPIPDWITRTLAAVSGYPTGRYVLADTIGRLPKLWIPAALGTVLAIPDRWLIGVSLGSVVFGGAAGLLRWWQLTRRRSDAGLAR